MMLRSRISSIAVSSIAAATLGGLAACGTASGGTAAKAPASSAAQQQAPAAAGSSAPGTATAPTLARTLGGIQIFDGAAAAPIVPPADPKKGSNNIQLNATDNARIGTYVSDTAGMTLYRFDKDTANPTVSNCIGSCATTWPPLLITSPGKIYTSGVAASLVGYVDRSDGSRQVTINGWPVYYFAKDAKAGDILGQGVGSTWFAVNPQGGRTSANVGTGAQGGAAPASSTAGY